MPVEISVEVSGVLQNLSTITPAIERELLKALDEAAAVVANSAKADHPVLPEDLRNNYSPNVVDSFRAVNWAGTGEFAGTYRFLSRTGVARNSIMPESAKKTAGRLESRVSSGVDYSNDLEFGTVDRRAFPFMRPALEVNRAWIQSRMEFAVRTGLQGGGGFKSQGFQ